MKCQISLKLSQIRGSPGTEFSLAAAPGKKISCYLRENSGIFKVNRTQRYNLLCFKMQRGIDLRPDNFTEAVNDIVRII